MQRNCSNIIITKCYSKALYHYPNDLKLKTIHLLLKKGYLILVILGCIYSCKNNSGKLTFIEKINSDEIASIKIYRHCETLKDADSTNLLQDKPCHIIVNLSPRMLISDFNKVDSIVEKQEIQKYKNFLLNHNNTNLKDIELQDRLDIRIALLVEFKNGSIDTLSFIDKNKIQVNESIILEYPQKLVKVFQNKYD